MRKHAFLLTSLLLLVYLLPAQQKEFSFNQVFRDAAPKALQALPNIQGWADEEHYIEYRKDDRGVLKKMLVDARTGQAAVWTKDSLVTPEPPAQVSAEKNPTPSPDGRWTAFTRGNDLYAREKATGKEIRLSSDGSDNVYNGYAAWVYYEEILGRASHYRAFWWSPDSRHLAFMHFDESGVPVFPIYNSEGHQGYLEKQHYPKAGDPNPQVRIGITSVDSPRTVWADFNQQDDQYFGTPVWTPDGTALWVQWMPRLQNHLTIYSVNPNSGIKKDLYDERQKTWITLADGGSRISFLNGGKQFILQSDRSGWQHLYLYNADGSLVNAITTGNFSCDLSEVDEKTRTVYFRARKENSARFDLYKISLDGKGLTRLTFGEYTHDGISISPGRKYFITTYSNLSTPPKMALVDTRGRIIRELGDSRSAEFNNYLWAKTELVRVKSQDGLFDLPMTITYPLHFDPSRKYPVLISIYGGPNAGTVYDRFNRSLSQQWWASEGLIQVSMDNRSSGHFGKAGMDYIYRQMGKYEIEDYMSCGRWLRSQPFVDSTRICITGGSFGGYMTCMALTYGADVFPFGMANSSVTDWSLYDTHYTERFMGTPKDNPEGYRITSPQNYVSKYHGLIRIVHGNMDDNVHMQNSIQLINKLEDLDKHFEFMIYPGERHGWGGLKRVHSGNESNKFIYDHLLQKPMPELFWLK